MCNHKIIATEIEYVCELCGTVIENIEETLYYTIRNHTSNNYNHDGKIMDGNTFYLGHTSNYKKHRYFMSSREVRDMRLAHFIETLKYYYPIWLLVDAHRAYIKASKEKKHLNMKKFIYQYIEKHKSKRL
ncbi:MAG: hypothetical protein QW156_04030 [Candidatus Aenigmatarchaeota archaeon]